MAHTTAYENILKSMSSDIITTDGVGNIDYINPKALRILYLNQAGVIDLDIQDLFPQVGKLFNECLQTGNVRMGYYVARSNHRLVIDTAPIRVEGEIEGVIATLHQPEDFTGALCYSDEYLKLFKQLDAIFKGSSDGLWVHDSNGKK